MKYYCNPVNINYRYQFNVMQEYGNEKQNKSGVLQIAREAADPSMIYFQGRYYIFASMTLGVWVSDDLVNWENHRLPENLPLYDYAPDIRVMGEYVYFSASKRFEVCNFYRTKNILEGPYEEIPGTFEFWDPNLFVDDDGRVYFYWGCSTTTPIWGVELDSSTMHPIGEKKELIAGNPFELGYERMGEDHSIPPRTDEEIEVCFQGFLTSKGLTEKDIPPEHVMLAKGMVSNRPNIEGAWMDKYQGKYYLQYACPGTECNVYADGVYISDSPLGPFVLADNNPYSYKPGGFLPGAGHGSTMWDEYQNLWHAATMRISVNHPFERRVGIWPAGFDADGELFCNQRYGDWPMSVAETEEYPWREPEWFLLSYKKKMTASSFEKGHQPELAADENVRTWWRAAAEKEDEWLEMDLGEACDVHGIQVNFADDRIEIPSPGEIRQNLCARYIEERELYTRWLLEGSLNGEDYFIIEDKSKAVTDLSHDFIVREEGIRVSYLKLTIYEVPYGQKPCISGVRVFGTGNGDKPEVPVYEAERIGKLDMKITAESEGAVGFNILWGHRPDKLYHSCMSFENTTVIGALIKDAPCFVRVDAFNENGITKGAVSELGNYQAD